MISQALFVAVSATFVSVFAHEPVHHAPHPYAFGYSIKDKHGEQHREESGTGGHAVKGSYGFTDARGVHRQMEYVADGAGFRATVKTNEPGTANQSPAAVQMISSNPIPYGPGQGFLLTPGAGLGGIGVGLGPVGAGLGGVPVGLGGVAAGLERVGAGLGGVGLDGVGTGLGGLMNGGNGLLGGLGYARYGY